MNNWRPLAAIILLLASIAPMALADAGITDNRILLGQTIGLTGQIAGSVKELNEGANAYIAMVNKRGGVNGRKIEIRSLDDKFDPALSAVNAEILINKERVFAFFQNRGTPHTEAILPILTAHGVPLVAPSTGAAIFHTPVNRLLFNVRAKYQDEVKKVVEHFTTLGIKSIGIIIPDDSFGRDALEGFNSAMAVRKLVPATVTIFNRAKPDIAASVTTAINARPDALIVVGAAQPAAELIKALRAAGQKMQIMTLSNNSTSAFVKTLGPAGPGVIVTQITPPPNLVTSGLGQEFKTAAKASGATVSYAAMEGFVAAKVLVEGLQRAGRDLTRKDFISALESIKREDLGGLLITYGEDRHTGSEFVELTMIGKDGRFVR